MVTNIEQYRKKKQIQSYAIEMVKVPVYARIYFEKEKLIGEFPTGRKEILTEFIEEE